MGFSLTACAVAESEAYESAITTDASFDSIEQHRYERVLESQTDGLFRVIKDDKRGFIDATGEIVIPCEYDDVAYSNGYFAVVKDEYLSIYDSEGNKVF